MKNICTFFLAIVLLSFFSSCVTTTPKYLHAPNGFNLIQVEKKNDIKVAVNYAATSHNKIGTGSQKQQSNGINIQTAYAITNKIAIKADAYKYWESDERVNYENPIYNFQLNYKRQSADIAIGYFNNNGKNENISFSAFTGIGIGSNSFDGYFKNDAQQKTYDAKYFKWFLMPSLTYKHNENYSVSFAYKLSVLKFNNLNTNDSTLKQGLYKNITTKNSLFGDFAIDNQFSFNNLKGFSFHAIVGISDLYTTFREINQTPNSTTIESGKYLINNRYGAIGVIANLNTLFAKK